jgi:hypothetical protein
MPTILVQLSTSRVMTGNRSSDVRDDANVKDSPIVWIVPEIGTTAKARKSDKRTVFDLSWSGRT